MKRISLITARERKSWTQEDLAAASGLSQATISNLESKPGKRPAFETVVALATALDVEPASLVFGPRKSRGVAA